MSIVDKARRSSEFNAWWQEYRSKLFPKVLQIDDEEYELPAGFPATTALMVVKEQAETDDLSLKTQWQVMTDLFGDEDLLIGIVERHQLDVFALNRLFENIMQMYSLGATEGNEPAAVIESTSSPNGH